MGTYLGQNFLVDMKVRDLIVQKIKKLYDDIWCEAMIEIGLGKWVLTKKLAQISNNFFVIEKDDSLVDKNRLTRDASNVEIVCDDVLEVDVVGLLKSRNLEVDKTLIVGNLPYYITSPILRKFFANGQSEFAGGIFMVQDEVACKLVSDVNKKSYLWWLVNLWYDVKYLKMVPAKSFKPAPKVKSAVIQIIPKIKKSQIGLGSLVEFLDQYAPFSRKTLGKINKMNIKKWLLKEFVIPKELEKKRLEELDRIDMEEILLSKK